MARNINKIIVLLFSSTLFYQTLWANSFYDVIVERVIDGDTIVISIPNVPEVFGKKISVRIAGIDTPELRANCPYEKGLANRAKDRVEGIIMKGQVVSLSNTKRDKYFRLLADVLVDGQNVAAALVNEGLAVTYSGGKKRDWCNYRKIR